jgi:hypothetical protein
MPRLADPEQAGPEANPSGAQPTPPPIPDPDLDPEATLESMRPATDRPPPWVHPNLGPGTQGSAAQRRDLITDPRVLGVLGSRQRLDDRQRPRLRPEGSFLTDRKGRLLIPKDGGATLFVFLADRPESPEPPMLLMPCSLTQQMERIARREPHAVFRLSGQVFVYRGANHLLPSLMQPARPGHRLRP